MKPTEILNEMVQRYPQLWPCSDDVWAAYERIGEAFADGRRLFICGNGGSAADAEHIVGELAKSFVLPRRLSETTRARLAAEGDVGAALADGLQSGLPAIPLAASGPLNSAIANDNGAEFVFAQQLIAYGNPGDVLLGLSTSGRSRNVSYAATLARTLSMSVVVLTGRAEGPLSRVADVAVRVPEDETYRVQELHLPVYHALCLMLEERFFGDGAPSASAGDGANRG